MAMDHRSGCPINLSIEVLGDRWSIIVLRDIMFGKRRSYRELLVNSEEGIATNILAARLKHLETAGLIEMADDPSHKQRKMLNLTDKAIALVPVMAQLGAWGVRFTPCTPELAIRARMLAEGGPPMWEDFMAELRHLHCKTPRPASGRSVLAELAEAYQCELAAPRHQSRI
ncbi:winged helix-turn-helix transcriptional regulator [Agrobacterium cavarae]|uniref:winged helix-turn-helix transcriptional regulator n=1 Tax=Agrobacterium cavarae TaxID=2528239 RepID=UPI003FD1C259